MLSFIFLLIIRYLIFPGSHRKEIEFFVKIKDSDDVKIGLTFVMFSLISSRIFMLNYSLKKKDFLSVRPYVRNGQLLSLI